MAAAGQQGKTNVIGRLRQGKARGGGDGGGVKSLNLKVFVMVVGVMGCLLLAASLVMFGVHQVRFRSGAISMNFRGLQELKQNFVRREQAKHITHGRLLQMATSAITKCKTSLMVMISHCGKSLTSKRANGNPVLPNKA